MMPKKSGKRVLHVFIIAFDWSTLPHIYTHTYNGWIIWSENSKYTKQSKKKKMKKEKIKKKTTKKHQKQIPKQTKKGFSLLTMDLKRQYTFHFLFPPFRSTGLSSLLFSFSPFLHLFHFELIRYFLSAAFTYFYFHLCAPSLCMVALNSAFVDHVPWSSSHIQDIVRHFSCIQFSLFLLTIQFSLHFRCSVYFSVISTMIKLLTCSCLPLLGHLQFHWKMILLVFDLFSTHRPVASPLLALPFTWACEKYNAMLCYAMLFILWANKIPAQKLSSYFDIQIIYKIVPPKKRSDGKIGELNKK